MNYIRGTIDINLILSTNCGGFLRWWIDAYYAVHPNMWVHTGVLLSTGIGFTIMNLTRQNINTCSSAESQMIGFRDYIPYV